MKKVIFDCDNTLGISNCDVDDGLTLLFLLGRKEFELLGVTLTYGNSSLEKVVEATATLQKKLGVDFPYYLGTENQITRESAASRFLAKSVADFPGEITIIATGALTNILGAVTYNPLFFKQVKSIVLMGGTIEPLKVNGKVVTELNFSCDPHASKEVLLSEASIVVMNGHMTAQALFPPKMIDQMIPLESKGSVWLSDSLRSWCQFTKASFGMTGFCNWDMATAMYLIQPDIFSEDIYYLSKKQNLSKGQLNVTNDKQDDSLKTIIMPKQLLDLSAFNQCMSTTIRAYLVAQS